MRQSLLLVLLVAVGCNGTTATSTSTTTTSSGNASAGTTGSGVTGTGTTSGSSGTSSSGVMPFTLVASPAAISLPANGLQTVIVNINRDPGNTGNPDSETITFSTRSSPTIDGGMIVTTFNPTSTTVAAVQATVTLTPPIPPGDYVITLEGTGSTSQKSATTPLTLTVTPPVATLLVDNDASDNNDPTNTNPVPSTDDTLFKALLSDAGIGFATQVINSNGSSSTVPSVSTLANYSTVVWYTGNNHASGANAAITSAQETALEDWLDVGGKTLLIFSSEMLGNLNYGGWAGPPSDTFVSGYIGAIGGDFDPHSVTYSGGGIICDGANSFVVSGIATTALAGQAFQVVKGTATAVDDTMCASVLNPAAGTTTLATLPTQDPSSATQLTDAPAAIVTLNSAAGTGATRSKVVYVGFEVGDLSPNPLSGPPELDAFAFFTSILTASR